MKRSAEKAVSEISPDHEAPASSGVLQNHAKIHCFPASGQAHNLSLD
jgi:hypothetical protein